MALELDHLASNQQQLVAGACSGRPRLTSPFGLVRRDVSHLCSPEGPQNARKADGLLSLPPERPKKGPGGSLRLEA